MTTIKTTITPAIGSYVRIGHIDLRTIDSLKFDDVLSRKHPILIYPEQILPITSYYNDSGRWVSDRDIVIKEGYGAKKISVGDELCLRVDNPANGDPTSATSYKVLINNREFPLLHFIPSTADGGALDDINHYDAYTQLRNLDAVLLGLLETPQQAFERKIMIATELIPANDFWVCKPMHSGNFGNPQKVIYQGKKWFRLRGSEWDDSQDEVFNIWGTYNTNLELAWDIVSNARVVLPTIEGITDEIIHTKWHTQYDYLVAENKRRYKQQQ